MAIDNLKALISDLHDSFGDEQTSPQQQQLMKQLQMLSHDVDANVPINANFNDTAELLLEEVRESYPKSAAIIKELINVLSGMGI